jgi:hypothetical protein
MVRETGGLVTRCLDYFSRGVLLAWVHFRGLSLESPGLRWVSWVGPCVLVIQTSSLSVALCGFPWDDPFRNLSGEFLKGVGIVATITALTFASWFWTEKPLQGIRGYNPLLKFIFHGNLGSRVRSGHAPSRAFVRRVR